MIPTEYTGCTGIGVTCTVPFSDLLNPSTYGLVWGANVEVLVIAIND